MPKVRSGGKGVNIGEKKYFGSDGTILYPDYVDSDYMSHYIC